MSDGLFERDGSCIRRIEAGAPPASLDPIRISSRLPVVTVQLVSRELLQTAYARAASPIARAILSIINE